MTKIELVSIMAAIIMATPDGHGDVCYDSEDSVTRALSIVSEVEWRVKKPRRKKQRQVVP